jgi:hypothetical protein
MTYVIIAAVLLVVLVVALLVTRKKPTGTTAHSNDVQIYPSQYQNKDGGQTYAPPPEK